MKKFVPLVLIIALFVLIFIPLKSSADSPPGSIRLLTNYKHKFDEFESTDTWIGKIWKEDGITITYCIGDMAGEWANPKKQSEYLWYKEQVIDKQIIRTALTRDNELRVTFPKRKANFYGTVKSQEDITEFLLIVLTY
jgi:MarR-like DNA-binding transcriptional regulator SgrR of sgrS sRNA